MTCGSSVAVPLLVSGATLAVGVLSLGWLIVPAPQPCAVPATVQEAAPPPPRPAPYVQWYAPRHHRVSAPAGGVRWTTPDGEVIVVPPPAPAVPKLPPPHRTRYVTPSRPRGMNPYLYGRSANPYVYPSPDPQDPQR